MSLRINIDGVDMECEPGRTVLEVARANGIPIPTLCHMGIFPENKSGACRICLVEVIGGGRKGLHSSCTLPATDGLQVSTTSDAVYQARRTVLELTLAEHKQDCTNCTTSGHCTLATLSRDYDVNGVSVCAECPNQKDGCLLRRGVLCMGPVTFANCNAYCTRRGYRCEGCHGVLVNEDLLRGAIRTFIECGFQMQDVLEAAKVFSFKGEARLEAMAREMGLIGDTADPGVQKNQKDQKDQKIKGGA